MKRIGRKKRCVQKADGMRGRRGQKKDWREFTPPPILMSCNSGTAILGWVNGQRRCARLPIVALLATSLPCPSSSQHTCVGGDVQAIGKVG